MSSSPSCIFIRAPPHRRPATDAADRRGRSGVAKADQVVARPLRVADRVRSRERAVAVPPPPAARRARRRCRAPPRASSSGLPRTAARQPMLLIVEDDLALQKQIKWSLDRFESLTASDRESALSQFRRHQPPDELGADVELPLVHLHPGSPAPPPGNRCC